MEKIITFKERSFNSSSTVILLAILMLNGFMFYRMETKSFIKEVKFEYEFVDKNENIVVAKSEVREVPKIEVGSKHMIPNWMWVDVENTEITGEDTCGIGDDGYLIILGEYDEMNVLCRFVLTGSDGGTACNHMTEFVIDKFVLSRFNEEFELKKARFEEHKRKVNFARC